MGWREQWGTCQADSFPTWQPLILAFCTNQMSQLRVSHAKPSCAGLFWHGWEQCLYFCWPMQASDPGALGIPRWGGRIRWDRKGCLWGAGFFGQVEIIRVATSGVSCPLYSSIWSPSLNFVHLPPASPHLKNTIAIYIIFKRWSEHIFMVLFHISVTPPSLLLVFTKGDQVPVSKVILQVFAFYIFVCPHFQGLLWLLFSF